MSYRVSRSQQKDIDTKFRAALLALGEIRHRYTLVSRTGTVELSQQWVSSPHVATVQRLRVYLGEAVSPTAYKGLRVMPVDDESSQQAPQWMGESGEVDFDLSVHSVRFSAS
jgi:hypothetical protein